MVDLALIQSLEFWFWNLRFFDKVFGSFSGDIVKSFASDSIALDADLDLSPLLLRAILALEVLLEGLLTTNELAGLVISPLVDYLLFAASDRASWDIMFGQLIWNVSNLEFTNVTALSGPWWLWVDIDLLAIFNPGTSLEAVPFAGLVFVDIAILVPVSLIPDPVVFVALFGWAPVVVLSTPEFVPDSFGWVPEPDLLGFGVLMAPVADLWVVRVFGDKVEAFLLFAQDGLVLGVDLFPSLAKVCLLGSLGGILEFVDSGNILVF